MWAVTFKLELAWDLKPHSFSAEYMLPNVMRKFQMRKPPVCLKSGHGRDVYSILLRNSKPSSSFRNLKNIRCHLLSVKGRLFLSFWGSHLYMLVCSVHTLYNTYLYVCILVCQRIQGDRRKSCETRESMCSFITFLCRILLNSIKCSNYKIEENLLDVVLSSNEGNM